MKTTLSCCALVLLWGCGDKEEPGGDETGLYSGDGADGTDGTDGTDAGCTDSTGRVTGVVTGPSSSDPNPYATVHAVGDGEDEEGPVDGDGVYDFMLTEGTWILYASESDCYSNDFEVEVTACETVEQDIRIEGCDIADKPNLYLYPDADTPMAVAVRHGPKQRIVASDPPHGAQGWTGMAHPDGRFSVGDDTAPFLFYEVSLAPGQGLRLQRQAGWCIDGSDPADAVWKMGGILEAYGFNAREVDDFVDAWLLDLPPAAAYSVYPQREVDEIASLDLDPSLPVERLWLLLDEGSGCAPLLEPEVEPMDRRGAHGVEWGVVLHDLGR